MIKTETLNMASQEGRGGAECGSVKDSGAPRLRSREEMESVSWSPLPESGGAGLD